MAPFRFTLCAIQGNDLTDVWMSFMNNDALFTLRAITVNGLTGVWMSFTSYCLSPMIYYSPCVQYKLKV